MTSFKRWYDVVEEMPRGCYRLAASPGGGFCGTLRCPTCGGTFTTARHTMTRGTVLPSVVCPRTGCTFHDSVVLEGTETP